MNYINKPMSEQPKVLNIDFASSSVAEISLTFEPLRDNQSFPKLIATVNMILKSKCPWKTVLWDNLTRTSEFIHSYMAVENPNMLKDARQWAYGIGQKIGGINSQFVKLPCHYIVLMHETTEKNETTGSVVTEPMIFSQYRNWKACWRVTTSSPESRATNQPTNHRVDQRLPSSGAFSLSSTINHKPSEG